MARRSRPSPRPTQPASPPPEAAAAAESDELPDAVITAFVRLAIATVRRDMERERRAAAAAT